MKKPIFVTFLPGIQNIHLVKDVGMIPSSLNKNYGYDSKIVVYKNREYPYFETDVKNLKKELFPLKYRKHNLTLNSILYLVKNSKKIDILHLYHPGNMKIRLYAYIFLTLNRKGLVYIHMDENTRDNYDDIFGINKNNFKSKLKRFMFEKFTFKKKNRQRILFGLQNDHGVKELKGEFPFDNIEYISNAYEDTTTTNYETERENIILFVGRVGNIQKRTDILLEGFKKASLKNWKLRLVGPIEDEFNNYLDKIKNEDWFKNVEIVGPIYDRVELKKEYNKAKIFCLTSDYESFGLVTVEALANGCTIVSSDIIASKEIINNGEFGTLFRCGDSDDLANKLVETCNNNKLQEYVQKNSKKYVDKKFSYKTTLKPLDKWIKEKLGD